MSFSILIVDDSRLARKFLKDALPDDIEFSISEASNGKEALEFIRNNQVDIMFLDLTMPEMDGFQLLKALKEDDATVKSPICELSRNTVFSCTVEHVSQA